MWPIEVTDSCKRAQISTNPEIHLDLCKKTECSQCELGLVIWAAGCKTTKFMKIFSLAAATDFVAYSEVDHVGHEVIDQSFLISEQV